MLEYVIDFFIYYILGVIISGKKRFSFEKQMIAVGGSLGVILGLWITSTWFPS